MKALLVYPFGGSDLRIPGEGLSRGQRMEDRVNVVMRVREIVLTWQRATQHVLVWKDSEKGKDVAQMPILGDTLAFLLERHQDEDCELVLFPIITCQQPPEPGDTMPLLKLFERFLEILPDSRVRLQILEASVVRESPSDYAAMDRVYRDQVYPAYQKQVKAGLYEKRYAQVTAGTPAMSMAAGVFARDPEIQFLYTPMGARTQACQLFLEELRGRTNELCQNLLDRCEWGAVVQVLRQEGNGYTRLIGEHPQQRSLHVAQALDHWWHRRYAEAVAECERGRLDAPAENAMREVCQVLVALGRSGEDTQDWPAIYQGLMLDAWNRLLISQRLQDMGGSLFALYAFNDACLLRGLSVIFPDCDLRWHCLDKVFERLNSSAKKNAIPFKFGNKLQTETDKLQALLVVGMDNDAGLKELVQRYLLLHWTLNTVLDDVRNYLVHGGTHLPENLLDERLASIGLKDNTYSALEQYIVIVEHIVENIRELPAVRDFAVRLHESLQHSIGRIETGPSTEERARIVTKWTEAYRNALSSAEKRDRDDLERIRKAFCDRIEDDSSFPQAIRPGVLTRLQSLDTTGIQPVWLVHRLLPQQEQERLRWKMVAKAFVSAHKDFSYLGSGQGQKYLRQWVKGEIRWEAVKTYLQARYRQDHPVQKPAPLVTPAPSQKARPAQGTQRKPRGSQHPSPQTALGRALSKAMQDKRSGGEGRA